MHDEHPDERGFAGVRARFQRREPGPHTLKWLTGFALFFVVISLVGDLFAPALVDSHPALLAAMNPRTRNLVLVTNQLDPATFYVVAFIRLVISDPIYYILGWYYGDRAVTWVENRHAETGELLRGLERFFAKASYPLVALMPNLYICVFAGAARMPPVRFAIVNAGGTLARLYLIRLFGEAFEQPIDSVLEFIKTYRLPLLAVSAAFVAYTVVKQTRTGTGDLGEIMHLEEDLEDEDNDERAEGDPH